MTVHNLQRIDVADNLFADDLPPLDFVLPGLLSGTVGVIVSSGGVGKSFLALETALSIAAGRDLFDIWQARLPAGPVVYLNFEDPALAMRHRIRTLGRQLEYECEFNTGPDPDTFDWPSISGLMDIHPVAGREFSIAHLNNNGLPEVSDVWRSFTHQMRKRSPRLVLLDPLIKAVPGLDENSSGHMSVVLRALSELAQEVGCAVVVLHHANKQSMVAGTGAEQQAIRGSSALSDNARWQANLMRMTAQDAKKRELGDRERRQWIKLDAPKMSYDTDPGARWLRRIRGGMIVGGCEPPEPHQGSTNGSKCQEHHDRRGGWRDEI